MMNSSPNASPAGGHNEFIGSAWLNRHSGHVHVVDHVSWSRTAGRYLLALRRPSGSFHYIHPRVLAERTPWNNYERLEHWTDTGHRCPRCEVSS